MFAGAAAVSRAETPVGLEAQGVDAQAALQSPADLDLRDELGRPISRTLLARDLKTAAAEASADSAFASRLPAARAIARVLELWDGLKASLSAPWTRLPWRELWALPGPKSVSRAGMAMLVLLAALVFSWSSARCRSCFLPSAGPGAPAVLRC